MRGWTQTLLVAVTLAGTTIQAQGQPTITLHVENHRGLPRQILDGTRARVEKVYEAIGVHTEWIEGENTANRPQDGLHLTVVLLSHDLGRKMAPGRLPDDVLGLSHVPIKRIYVFCDRIAAVPGSPTMFPVSLGNIIAHEIGHFLLGNGHSRNGIMRANVGIHDLHLENFDETQARTIRSRLGEQRRSPVARSIQQSSNLEDIAWFENREPFLIGFLGQQAAIDADRACGITPENGRAWQEYRRSLDLWKSADTELPELRDARRAVTRLQAENCRFDAVPRSRRDRKGFSNYEPAGGEGCPPQPESAAVGVAWTDPTIPAPRPFAR